MLTNGYIVKNFLPGIKTLELQKINLPLETILTEHIDPDLFSVDKDINEVSGGFFALLAKYPQQKRITILNKEKNKKISFTGYIIYDDILTLRDFLLNYVVSLGDEYLDNLIIQKNIGEIIYKNNLTLVTKNRRFYGRPFSFKIDIRFIPYEAFFLQTDEHVKLLNIKNKETYFYVSEEMKFKIKILDEKENLYKTLIFFDKGFGSREEYFAAIYFDDNQILIYPQIAGIPKLLINEFDAKGKLFSKNKKDNFNYILPEIQYLLKVPSAEKIKQYLKTKKLKNIKPKKKINTVKFAYEINNNFKIDSNAKTIDDIGTIIYIISRITGGIYYPNESCNLNYEYLKDLKDESYLLGLGEIKI